LKEGDTLIFDSVSRMSRNSEEGSKLYEDLYNKNISLVFLKEPHINTDVFKQQIQKQINFRLETGNQSTDKFVNAVVTAVKEYSIDIAKEQIRLAFEQSEKEVQDLHQRTKEGILTARLNGKQIGLKKGTKLITKKSNKAKAIILKHSKYFDGALNDEECRKLAGISRNTYYKYKLELKDII